MQYWAGSNLVPGSKLCVLNAGLQDGRSVDVVHQSNVGDDEQAANYDSAASFVNLSLTCVFFINQILPHFLLTCCFNISWRR